LIQETVVGREKDVHDIDVHGEFKKLVVTLLVMRAFSNSVSGTSSTRRVRSSWTVLKAPSVFGSVMTVK